ncbi:MAG: CHAT domain-containing protein [Myxacorys californica WJT36-NPBG1]|nr:CHAT domain-containing protein [Myxacorys californica WJT36-NPBG1]
MDQEFFLSVTPVRATEYLVRTEGVSPGVPLAEELVTWQVDEWLEQARQLMHDPLLGLLRGNLFRPRTGHSPEDAAGVLVPNLVEFGQTLYNALFQGTIRDSWMTAQGIAQNRREGLRLRLGLKGDLLPRLPWEVLHAGVRPLATGTDVVFSRYQAAFAPMATVLTPHRSSLVEQSQALRILMVLAAPTDQEVLELEREATHLREELMRDQGSAAGEIELTILNQPGRERLTQALEQGRFHILHYAGHSNLGMSGGDLYLVNDRTGLTEVLSGDDLAGLLVNNGIRMAVFNSCRGVYTATADPTKATESGNLAEALLKRGVPAVLAMAERIPDDVALTLSRLFYRNLKQRYPIDLSLSRARQGLLSSYGSNQLYWSLPILYLHPDFDGYLQPPLVGELPTPELVTPTRSVPEAVSTATPVPFVMPDDLLDELELDNPDDRDREEVLNLLRELQEDSDHPFYEEPPDTFFESEDFESEDRLQSSDRPRTAADFVASGEALYANGDVAGAIAAYSEALQLDSRYADAYSKMGIALEEYDSPAEAIIAYQMALQLNPNLVEAEQNLRRLKIAHNFGTDSTGRAISQEPSDLAQSSESSGASLVKTETPPHSRVFAKNLKHSTRRRPWLTFGIAGTAVAAVLAIWGISTLRSSLSPSNVLPDPATLPTSNPPASQTGMLTATATQSFRQGDLRKGQEATEALLDQNNLVQATSAIEAVPNDKQTNPAISFLRGRVAWQSLQQSGNRTFSIGDVRRYWKTAVDGKPEPLYYNALGFAYYAEGNLKRAGEAWKTSARLAAEQQKLGATAATGKANPALQDEMTAYAGIALAYMKTANQQPPKRQASLKRQAIILRNRILRQTPTEFEPNALAKNWLWTESAIAEWRALLAAK